MTSMNRFGATQAMFLTRFATGSYSPTDVTEFGGSDAVDAALDSAEDQVIQALPEEVFLQLTQIDLQFIEMRASAGQTVANLSFAPVIPGKTYIWKGQPKYFKERPYKSTDLLPNEVFFDPNLVRPVAELTAGTDYTLADSTGIVTFTTGLAANDQVAASYWPDVTDEDYVVPSLAQCVADGAAYLRASILYPRASTQWEYLAVLADQFTKKLTALQDKTWIPPELRLMNFWKEVVPISSDNPKIKVGRLQRG